MALKTPHYIEITPTTVVRLQLDADAYPAGLKTQLGIEDGVAGGGPPTGKTLVGTGRLAAAQRGCFGIGLVYAKTPTKNQTAKVMCSPSKADTVFVDAIGSKYRTFDILEVRVPRRRVYTF